MLKNIAIDRHFCCYLVFENNDITKRKANLQFRYLVAIKRYDV